MDIARLKREYGHRITLLGNIDCGGILVNGTPEQVREETKHIIRVAAPGGGFVLASSGAITDATPMGNLQAMLEAGREYGTYPLLF